LSHLYKCNISESLHLSAASATAVQAFGGDVTSLVSWANIFLQKYLERLTILLTQRR